MSCGDTKVLLAGLAVQPPTHPRLRWPSPSASWPAAHLPPCAHIGGTAAPRLPPCFLLITQVRPPTTTACTSTGCSPLPHHSPPAVASRLLTIITRLHVAVLLPLRGGGRQSRVGRALWGWLVLEGERVAARGNPRSAPVGSSRTPPSSRASTHRDGAGVTTTVGGDCRKTDERRRRRRRWRRRRRRSPIPHWLAATPVSGALYACIRSQRYMSRSPCTCDLAALLHPAGRLHPIAGYIYMSRSQRCYIQQVACTRSQATST